MMKQNILQKYIYEFTMKGGGGVEGRKFPSTDNSKGKGGNRPISMF